MPVSKSENPLDGILNFTGNQPSFDFASVPSLSVSTATSTNHNDYPSATSTHLLDELFKPEIYIRAEKVGGRRKVTTINGLDDGTLDIKAIIRTLSNLLHTSASESYTETKIKGIKKTVKVIQVQGDHREAIKEWLITSGTIPRSEVDRIHVSVGNNK